MRSTRSNARGWRWCWVAYLVEWTVRGYMPFRYLRTINLGMIVPWYDTVPQIGAVLFAAGWFAGPRRRGERPPLFMPIRAAAAGVAPWACCAWCRS